MGSRFVRPDTTVLRISEGDTLTVRRRLSAGEQRAMYGRMYIAGADGSLKANPLAHGVAIVTAYLLDWSLTDDTGRAVSIRGMSPDDLSLTLDALDQETFTELMDAVTAHEEAMRAERDQEKNAKGGAIRSSAISPSPVGVAGDTSGSSN